MESREQERQATRRTIVLGGEQQSGRLTKKGVDESPSPSGRESETKHEASRILSPQQGTSRQHKTLYPEIRHQAARARGAAR
jgi:hypothetical protein